MNNLRFEDVPEFRDSLTQAEKVEYLNGLRALLLRKLKRPVSDFDLIIADIEDHWEVLQAIKRKR